MAEWVKAAGQAFGLWRTASEISPRVIADEAARGFVIALIGPPERCAQVLDALLADAASDTERLDARSHFRCFDHTPDPDTARGFTFRLYLAGEDAPIGGRDADSVPFSGDLDQVVRAMLELRPSLAVAMARRVPKFRLPACRLLVRSAALANAQLALISALPGVLPVTAPFLPASSLADVVMLTKNQAMLVMRLAAAHGQRPGYTRQVKELLGTIASALGWRTLAREAVALVPAGVGAGFKAAIAYSGTMAVGQAALFFYQKGFRPTAAQIREFEREGRAQAEEEVRRLRESEGAADTSPVPPPPDDGV